MHHTIESIAAGSVRPSRLILALDSQSDWEIVLKLRTVKRLRRRGLEILVSSPVGSHAKYFPYVVSETRHTVPLATADDDILYPTNWLAGLLSALEETPDQVRCYRAHRFTLSAEGVAPYATWPPVLDDHPSFTSFLTGVSGVIYPPAFLDALRTAGDRFTSLAPKADDVWLNARAVEGGFRVAQVSDRPQHFPVVIGTQVAALWRHNTDEEPGGISANDAQIDASYTPEALRKIAEEGV